MDAIFWNSLNGGNDLISRYVGPYKINHWIKKHGYTGQVIDFVNYLTEEELYLSTKKFITSDTLVIGVSATFITYNTEGVTNGFRHRWKNGFYSAFPENVFNALKRIKTEYPNIKFVLGGYSSEHMYGGGLFDATIMSYTEASEDIFLEYLDFLKKGTEPPFSKLIMSYAHVAPGIPVKSRIYYYQARNKVYNIEHDDFRFSKQDAVLFGETLPLDISRGCIFACRFCQYPHLGKGKLDYTRGMEYIKDELISTGMGDIRASGKLIQQTLVKGSNANELSGSTTLAVDWQTNAGWYVDLNTLQNSGERVSLDPEQQLGVLRVVSNVPDQVACRPTAQSWIYEFDYLTGSYLPLATRQVVARKISDSTLTAGMRTIKLGEKILGLLTDETGKVTNVSSAAPATTVISVKRVSWRELDEQ
jgi:hypothetical protein